jgi:hypothetical protein
MAVAMYMNFPTASKEKYEKVMKELNLKEKLPPGLLHHVAGPLDGGWCVMDVWESQAHFDRFFKERLKAAMQNAGVQPAQPKTFPVHNTLMAGAMSRR